MDERQERQRNYLRAWRLRNREFAELLRSEDLEPEEGHNHEINNDNSDLVLSERENDFLCSDYGAESAPSSSDNEEEGLFPFPVVNNLENEMLEGDFSKELGKWMLSYNISRAASNALLTLLRNFGHEEHLPKDSRTILRTDRNVPTISKCGGEYIYLGLKNGMNRYLDSKNDFALPENVKLLINVDGVPLHKSLSTQMWPILCCIENETPFIVALFVGEKKPSDPYEFCSDFLEEYNKIKQYGFHRNGQAHSIEISAFVCDAPARQFLKCIKGHTGYHSCERCLIEGTYESSRVVFLETNSAPRDGISFRSGNYLGSHQLQESPLSQDFDCVSKFPLDYMHLVCLGVVKRLLLAWKEGSRRSKLSPSQLAHLSQSMISFRGIMPSDFSRQPRGLEELKRWKATEFRQFLLYTGPVVLKNVLNSEKYKHFLCLSIAMRNFLDSNAQIRNSFLEFGKGLLNYFVAEARNIYGNSFVVYNVHSLIHLWEDVNKFKQSLDSISSFPFENFLQTLKKMVRKPQSSIQQVVKLIGSYDTFLLNPSSISEKQHPISPRDKDSWCLLKTGRFAKVVSINKNILDCKVISKRRYENLFEEPCESSLFNIVFVKNSSSLFQLQQVLMKDIARKAVCMHFNEGFVFFPLLHGVDVDL